MYLVCLIFAVGVAALCFFMSRSLWDNDYRMLVKYRDLYSQTYDSTTENHSLASQNAESITYFEEIWSKVPSVCLFVFSIT